MRRCLPSWSPRTDPSPNTRSHRQIPKNIVAPQHILPCEVTKGISLSDTFVSGWGLMQSKSTYRCNLLQVPVQCRRIICPGCTMKGSNKRQPDNWPQQSKLIHSQTVCLWQDGPWGFSCYANLCTLPMSTFSTRRKISIQYAVSVILKTKNIPFYYLKIPSTAKLVSCTWTVAVPLHSLMMVCYALVVPTMHVMEETWCFRFSIFYSWATILQLFTKGSECIQLESF